MTATCGSAPEAVTSRHIIRIFIIAEYLLFKRQRHDLEENGNRQSDHAELIVLFTHHAL
jgi:hypothetical protein